MVPAVGPFAVMMGAPRPERQRSLWSSNGGSDIGGRRSTVAMAPLKKISRPFGCTLVLAAWFLIANRPIHFGCRCMNQLI